MYYASRDIKQIERYGLIQVSEEDKNDSQSMLHNQIS